MKKVLTYRGAVMTWECDSNRHMNVMYYINKFEYAGRHFDLTLQLSEVRDNKEEVGVVVLEQTVKYFKEVFEDDLIYIETSLLDIGNKTFTVLHEMYNSHTKELVSSMRAILVLFDKVHRKALPFPTAHRAMLLLKMSE